MIEDSRRLVTAAYDAIADAYLERFGVSTVRQKWLRRLLARLPVTGGRVLDLGCGAGIPVARELESLGHTVVGIDGSAQQIARARQNVPRATFIEGDMCELAFAAIFPAQRQALRETSNEVVSRDATSRYSGVIPLPSASR
jgi:ubiquinone/menaquinone biosynthesis C-methylase UbiE